jgi:HSP20 family protein
MQWNGFPQLSTLHDQVNRLFEDTLRTTEGAVKEWVPRVDIYETEHALVMQFDLPGVKQDDLDIKVEKDTLIIQGERKPADNFENYRRVERVYGAFTRVFSIPDYIDRDGVEANLSNGVLTLTLKKREETKPKQIQVKVQAA